MLVCCGLIFWVCLDIDDARRWWSFFVCAGMLLAFVVGGLLLMPLLVVLCVLAYGLCVDLQLFWVWYSPLVVLPLCLKWPSVLTASLVIGCGACCRLLTYCLA